MQQYTPEEIDSAQIAKHMTRSPAAFARLLHDHSQDTAELAARVLRGLNILRRIENEPKPSETINDGRD